MCGTSVTPMDGAENQPTVVVVHVLRIDFFYLPRGWGRGGEARETTASLVELDEVCVSWCGSRDNHFEPKGR